MPCLIPLLALFLLSLPRQVLPFLLRSIRPTSWTPTCPPRHPHTHTYGHCHCHFHCRLTAEVAGWAKEESVSAVEGRGLSRGDLIGWAAPADNSALSLLHCRTHYL